MTDSYRLLSAAQKYVVLALAADILLADRAVVFHYYGPSALRKLAKNMAASGIAGVIAAIPAARQEAQSVEDAPPFFRKTYLLSQLDALSGLLTLNGVDLCGSKLIDAVERVLGFTPPLPYAMEQLQAEQKSVLASYGYASYQEFQARQQQCPGSELSEAMLQAEIAHLFDEFRRDLLPHLWLAEEFTASIDRSRVQVEPNRPGYPPCYYMYKGKGRAIVSLSGQHRSNRLSAVRTLMHEVCPGHHMYYLYRELLFRRKLLGDEATIDLVYSSETPISEGVAETALGFLSHFAGGLLPQVRIATAREHYCKKVLYNVWYRHFVAQDMSREDAASYLLEQAGFAREQIEPSLGFVEDWRVYYPSYPVGTATLQSWVGDFARQRLYYFYLPKSMPVWDKFTRWHETARQCQGGDG